jgi:serine protease inhibitor ecotin
MMSTDSIKPKPEPEQELTQGITAYDPGQAEERIKIALLRHQAIAVRIAHALGPTEKRERL